MKRCAPVALLIAVSAALVMMILGYMGAALVLTVTCVIGILSTFCLEGALLKILQPGRPRMTRDAAVLLVAHFAIWGVYLAALFRWQDMLDLWAVAVGLGCFLLGLSLGGIKTNDGLSPREE